MLFAENKILETRCKFLRPFGEEPYIPIGLGSGGTVVFSSRSRPSLIREKPVPIPYRVAVVGILIPISPGSGSGQSRRTLHWMLIEVV